ncbi:outer membrane protein [Tabrizicola sp. BL-A-41-H6]|uniref:outer membrane protein n=1 Tax=Tabrizicola sp. BL-A-41-H6 TaxID=3421107 RepID=UPI003D66988E
MRMLVAAVAASLMGSTAFAQDSGWQYNLTAYLWATDTGVSAETPFGTVDAELSFSDALQDLDFAFMGAFEARKGKLSFFTDAMYFKLSPTTTGPGGVVDVTVPTQMTIISGFAGYRVYEDPSVSVDLAGGFRWAKLDSDPRFANGDEFSVGDSWADPVLGLRISGRLSDKMTATLFTDYGGFSGESNTWQASATLGYDLNDRWTLLGGYRYMEFNREIDGRDFSLDQSGLLLGATYKF